jgi:hypothetical protein
MKIKEKKAQTRRTKGVARRLMNKDFRDAYLASQLKSFLADQIRSLRGGMSQKEFSKLLGKPQSVVSRLEDPEYGKVTLHTLLEIASKLDVALIVRFVDYTTYLDATSHTSPEALRPAAFTSEDLKGLSDTAQ